MIPWYMESISTLGSYMNFVICMVRSYHLFIYYGLGARCLNMRCITLDRFISIA